MPEPHAFAVLAVAATAFYLYTRPRLRAELVSLALLLALIVIFHLFPHAGAASRMTDTEVLQAFGHPALVAICSLMILARGLTMTGAMEPAMRWLARVWGWSRPIGLLVTLLLTGAASAFVNDTPVLVLALPMLLGLAERVGYPASKTLMPVNFGILAGGMLTSVGTSTNLLVLSIAADLGMRPMGIFDFSSTALGAFAVALPYLWLVAPRLLPANPTTSVSSGRLFDTQLVLDASSTRLLGRTPAELEKMLGRALPLTGFLRGGQVQAVDAGGKLSPGDVLLLRDTPGGLRELASTFQVQLFDREGVGRFVEADTAQGDSFLAEVVIDSESSLVGRSLRHARFAESHHVVAIGFRGGVEGLLRDGRGLADKTLAAGDVLLVQGRKERLAELRSTPGLLLLDSSTPMPRSPLAPWALGIMAAVVLAAAGKWLPIHVAAFLGVVAMLLTGCVKLEGLGRAISLEVVLLVASSVALGQSLVHTGAAAWVAGGVAALAMHVPPAAQVALFMAFAALLTNFVSNSAAAAVGTPIAVATAVQLGSPLEPFVLAILFGANLSYATPMAYQTNLLVMSAARYTFRDFLRVGTPLVVLMLATLSLLLARRYGL
ncbi:MAG: SLC13 family permease [Holophagales bacterium]|nr:MAG: SLC13 family permease [Holophagales bacterium]